jgi:predicted anti-sigma-YlaC factor YlaD
MAYRRKTAPARRKAPVRRRRSMGARVTTASITAATMSAGKAALGGVAAAFLSNTVGKQLGAAYTPYVGLVGSVATSLFLKQPEIAAGMAGYSGAKIGQALLGADSAIGSLLAENAYAVSPSMYLQGYDTPGMAGEGIYASNYTLAGYDVPGM